MRNELSPFMNGELVCLVGEIIKFRPMRFDGEAKLLYVNPKTGLTIPMEFWHKDVLVDPIRLINNTTSIKPLQIEEVSLCISHMWIARKIDLPIGTRFKLRGHILAYQRKDRSKDFCFIPYDLPTILGD